MVQRAKVIGFKNGLAEIEVSRKAMCDGCHKMQCSGKCAMSGIMSSGKKMTAYAINKADAEIGDSVEVSTSDKEVLGAAAAVFILPLIMGLICYVTTTLLGLSSDICIISAVVGFIIVFPFLRIFERKMKNNEPRLTILRILSDDDNVISDDE
ncbi:MAG: hypothetical protein E7578_00885 [Ruminococcaceae bacterium]|nr:hypothetical protein [Oscillospiraceae bacterium]